MIGALWNGISGLNSFEKALSTESNNISNVNTVGYKEDIITFSDLMYERRTGKGVQIESVSKAMYQQGGIKLTNNDFDVAIEGKGYFIVGDVGKNNTPEIFYTRAGNFKIAEDGILKTQNNMNILGLSSVSVPANAKFEDIYTQTIASQVANNSNALQTINARTTDYLRTVKSDDLALQSGNNYKTKSAKITDIEALIADYKSKLDLYASDSTAASTNSVSQITNVNLSNSMAQLINENDLVKITINNNEIKQFFDTDINTTLKKFSDKISNIQGLSSSINPATGQLTITSLIPAKEVKIQDAQINTDFLAITNTQNAKLGSGIGLVNSSRDVLKTAIENAGGKFLDITTSVSLANQNNLAQAGQIQLSLSNLNLSNNMGTLEIEDGIIYAKDGENKFVIGKLQTAHFVNEQGLNPQGTNLFQVTSDSGEALYAGDMNKLVGRSLEQSKANLGNSLTALLIYQKAFEASSKSITTSDDMLKTAIELKR
ncbi:MAG: flagellar hook protein FlgE [Aliarcobacter sp.]|nr:flagellar hook protein FlgE [Aliarcobacter sp.]